MFRLEFFFFFFNDTATTEIYTLSLHDALPTSGTGAEPESLPDSPPVKRWLSNRCSVRSSHGPARSEPARRGDLHRLRPPALRALRPRLRGARRAGPARRFLRRRRRLGWR